MLIYYQKSKTVGSLGKTKFILNVLLYMGNGINEFSVN